MSLATKNPRIIFDGTASEWTRFRWQVQNKLRRLKALDLLELPFVDVLQAIWIQEGLDEADDDTKDDRLAIASQLGGAKDKAEEFITEALRGRAIDLVASLPHDAELFTFWTTLSSAFEGKGTKSDEQLLAEVEHVQVNSNVESIVNAISAWDALYRELAARGEATSEDFSSPEKTPKG
jgi:hypothetical protein